MRTVAALAILFISSSISAMSPPQDFEALFAKYPASVVQPFVKPEVQIGKGTNAYKFRRAIRRQAKSGINFGGRWVLVSTVCGTSCTRFFLVDGVSGAVSDPGLIATNGTPIFKKESALLLVNPTASSERLKGWIVKNGQLEPVQLE